jgi:hypothetical protein
MPCFAINPKIVQAQAISQAPSDAEQDFGSIKMAILENSDLRNCELEQCG